MPARPRRDPAPDVDVMVHTLPPPPADEPAPKPRDSEPLRSSVSLWRQGRARRWSIRVVAGDEDRISELVRQALEAERRLKDPTE